MGIEVLHSQGGYFTLFTAEQRHGGRATTALLSLRTRERIVLRLGLKYNNEFKALSKSSATQLLYSVSTKLPKYFASQNKYRIRLAKAYFGPS